MGRLTILEVQDIYPVSSGILPSPTFLVLPSCLDPLLGRDLMQKPSLSLSLTSPSPIFPLKGISSHKCQPCFWPLPAFEVNPRIWETSTLGLCFHHSVIHIVLRDYSVFSYQAKYPICRKHHQDLKPIIQWLVKADLLTPTQSPNNTPNLPVIKLDGFLLFDSGFPESPPHHSSCCHNPSSYPQPIHPS